MRLFENTLRKERLSEAHVPIRISDSVKVNPVSISRFLISGLVALTTALGSAPVLAQAISPKFPALQIEQMHSAIYTKEFANLEAPAVRAEVFRTLGLIRDNPLLSNVPLAPGQLSARQVENNYIDQLIAAIAGASNDFTQLHLTMVDRANAPRLDADAAHGVLLHYQRPEKANADGSPR